MHLALALNILTNLRIAFPVLLIVLACISIVVSALGFNNHGNLVESDSSFYVLVLSDSCFLAAGNRIIWISDLIDSWSSHVQSSRFPTSPIWVILTNPYVLSPLLFCISVLLLSVSIPL